MSFNIRELKAQGRTRASNEIRKSRGSSISAEEILLESNRTKLFSSNPEKTFDIFLSHSSIDAEIILGMLERLETHGFEVYVDWIDDANLDRGNITKSSIDTLRERMSQSKCLLFATTETYAESKWMPWELGYMDGLKNRAAILPLFETEHTASDSFRGQEYLGAYPYCVEAPIQNTDVNELWICASANTYVSFNEWLAGRKPFKR